MSKYTDSFGKLREIEEELDSLKDYKNKKSKEKDEQGTSKIKNDIDTSLLKNINISCMRMEKDITEISSNIQKLVKLFKAAMEGKSPEDIEDSMEEKVQRLVDQNAELLARLNSMNSNMNNFNNDFSKYRKPIF